MDILLSNSRERRSENVPGSSEKALARREGQGLVWPDWAAFRGWYGLQALLRRELVDMRC